MKFPFFVSTSWEEFSRQVIRQVGTDWNQGTGKWNLVAMSVGTEGVTPCVNAAGPPGRFHHETTLLTAFSRKPARWGNSIPEKESGRFNWFLKHSNETKTCPFRKRGGAFYVTSSHLVSSFTWINRELRRLQLITNDQNSLIPASYMRIFPRNLNIFGLLMKNKTFKDVILDVWEEINVFLIYNFLTKRQMS